MVSTTLCELRDLSWKAEYSSWCAAPWFAGTLGRTASAGLVGGYLGTDKRGLAQGCAGASCTECVDTLTLRGLRLFSLAKCVAVVRDAWDSQVEFRSWDVSHAKAPGTFSVLPGESAAATGLIRGALLWDALA